MGTRLSQDSGTTSETMAIRWLPSLACDLTRRGCLSCSGCLSPSGGSGCAAMPMPPSPLARLSAFRSELHGSFTRRADALFELGDALLCSQTPFPSLPHLS